MPGTATIGDVLTCLPGYWGSMRQTTPTVIGYTFQWQRGNSDGSSFVDITGATTERYIVQTGDSGKAIRCRVTATNADGSASSASDYDVVTAYVATYNPKVWITEADHAGPPSDPVRATPLTGDAITAEFTALWNASKAYADSRVSSGGGGVAATGQTGMRAAHVTGDTTITEYESGVFVDTPGVIVTLPSGRTSASDGFTYTIVNLSFSTIHAKAPSGGLIDPWAHGENVSQVDIAAEEQTTPFIPDSTNRSNYWR